MIVISKNRGRDKESGRGRGRRTGKAIVTIKRYVTK